MKLIKKYIPHSLFIILIHIIIISIFIYSFLYPGKIQAIDQIRLSLQTNIINIIGETMIEDFDTDIQGNPITSPNAINYMTLKPYLTQLRPGDIIFTNSEKYMSSELIPGRRKHAALYLGTYKQIQKLFGKDASQTLFLNQFYQQPNDRLIIDASNDGVLIRSLDSLSNMKNISLLTNIISFRPQISLETKKQMIGYALKQYGKKYDYDLLNVNDEALYCSELIQNTLNSIGITTTKITTIFNREFIVPQDLIDSITSDSGKQIFMYIFGIEKQNGTLKAINK